MASTLEHARDRFTNLLNALDDARADCTDTGEEILDIVVMEIERAVARFDAAFGREDA